MFDVTKLAGYNTMTFPKLFLILAQKMFPEDFPKITCKYSHEVALATIFWFPSFFARKEGNANIGSVCVVVASHPREHNTEAARRR